MKKLLVFSLFTCLVFAKIFGQTQCDIQEIYAGVDAENDVKVLTVGNDLVEAEVILVPTELDIEKYSVSVTRKDSDLYKIDGKDIYIETRYCYEYATYEDVILIIESNYGYSKGELIFTN